MRSAVSTKVPAIYLLSGSLTASWRKSLRKTYAFVSPLHWPYVRGTQPPAP